MINPIVSIVFRFSGLGDGYFLSTMGLDEVLEEELRGFTERFKEDERRMNAWWELRRSGWRENNIWWEMCSRTQLSCGGM